jgi:elongation factor P
VTDKTWRAGEKVETAMIEKNKMQYSYNDSDMYIFMDLETYEQLQIPKEKIEYQLNFLKEMMEVNVIMFENEILGVDLPEKVTLKVVDTVPGVRGNTVTNATKDATLETGYLVQVPLFIENDDEIIVSTQTGKYNTKA